MLRKPGKNGKRRYQYWCSRAVQAIGLSPSDFKKLYRWYTHKVHTSSWMQELRKAGVANRIVGKDLTTTANLKDVFKKWVGTYNKHNKGAEMELNAPALINPDANQSQEPTVVAQNSPPTRAGV